MDRIKQVLLEADTGLFRFINGTLHNGLLASAMKFTANDIFLAALALAGIFFIAKAGGKTAKQNMAFSLWAIIAVNLLCAFLLKPVFRRPRPFEALQGVNLLVTFRKYGWSFPSTHTAMAAALAVVLWDDYKEWRWLLALFVFAVGFFCVYTGGHYPSDVVGGLFIGVIIGKIFDLLKKRTAQTQKLKVKSQKE
jgi:undecaprenyl-diphosphatase